MPKNQPAEASAVEEPAVEAAAVDEAPIEEPVPVFRLRLKEDVNAAQFMALGRVVELTADDPVFETESQPAYLGARGLPFLEELA